MFLLVRGLQRVFNGIDRGVRASAGGCRYLTEIQSATSQNKLLTFAVTTHNGIVEITAIVMSIGIFYHT